MDSSSAEMPSFKLNNGASIPAIGLGVADVNQAPEERVSAAVLHAIKVGYRHFDTGSMYGTEVALGDGISQAISTGMTSREDLFITSKLWCNSHDPQDVEPALRHTLMNLKLEYLDLYLIHLPIKTKKEALTSYILKMEDLLPLDLEGTWHALENCLEKGLTKSIGVSNFSIKHLQQLLVHARVPPAVNQVEMNPIWQQHELRRFCEGVGIHVSAWSPLHAPGTFYGTDDVVSNHMIQSIATKYKKTPAQIALRWGVQAGVSVLPKSFNFLRIAENFSIFDWELSTEDMTNIFSIKQKSTGIFEDALVRQGLPVKRILNFEDVDQ